jgi:enoyl-CoA hydratase
MDPAVRLTYDDTIATLSLETLTMAPRFFDELAAAISEVATRTDLRALIVRSSAKHFSYGLDLPEAFKAFGPSLAGGGLAATRHELRKLIRRWQEAFAALHGMSLPTLAAIHGWCIGGGLDLASACDVRLASADARISLRETRVALVADLGSLQRLPAIIGQGRTRELAFTGKDIGAQEALAMGLVNAVLPDRTALDAEARVWARAIAANSPLAVQGAKQVLNFGEGRTTEAGLEYVATWNAAFLASEDLAEAASAFLARREPRFKGR